MKKGILGFAVGAVAGYVGKVVLDNKQESETQAKVDKFKGYYNMLNHWLALRQSGKSLVEYFEKNDYKTIAIYGMGEMGSRLCEELNGSDIVVQYGIDKKLAGFSSNINIVDVDDDLGGVDVVVVTSIFAFDEIEEELRGRVDCPIVSLDDIIFSL